MRHVIELGEGDEVAVQTSEALPGVVLVNLGAETLALDGESARRLAAALLDCATA